MTDACEQLHAYVDGELDDAEHTAFEIHLASCDACGAELPSLLALVAAFDAPVEPARSSAGHLALVAERTDDPGGPDGGTHAPVQPRRAPSEPPVPAPVATGRRQRWPVWAGSGAAMAALAAVALLMLKAQPDALSVTPDAIAKELAASRKLEPRLSYPGTAGWRPFDVPRSAERTGEAFSTKTRLALETAKDAHGLAVVSLLAGERERAAQLFAAVPSSPAADVDRAALELLDGSTAALERGLAAVDRALAARPDDPAGLWNRALVLAALNLPLAAAGELDRVAAAGEPGWADEARARAAALRSAVSDRKARWRRTYDAGRALVEHGTPVPNELVAVTGTTTVMLYDAVRAAPSAARVQALLPLAQALDATYHSDRLAGYVQRVAASDFTVRAPLAERYRELALRRLSPPSAIDAFGKQLAAGGADDIRLGALVHAGAVAANLDEYQRLAAAARDPWFTAIAEHEIARAEIARGDQAAADRRLSDALAAARTERLSYRALMLGRELVGLRRKARQLGRAAALAQTMYRDAIASGEWVMEMGSLLDLVAIQSNRYEHSLARAYSTELGERVESGLSTGLLTSYECPQLAYAHLTLANIWLSLQDLARARDEMKRVPACSTPSLIEPSVWTELYRASGNHDDAQHARERLAALRAAPEQLPAQEALFTYLEGSLALRHDRAEGRRLLRESIAKAGPGPAELRVKTRAYAFARLALDFAGAGEFTNAIAVLAESLELAAPTRCAVAVAAQEGSAAVVFVDARGEPGGAHFASRTDDLDAATLVPAAAIARLRSCERITVLARAPILGAGKLLPPDLAWSYALPHGTAGKPAAPAPAMTGTRLVVANPIAPTDLGLPPLGQLPNDVAAGASVLRGADATPSRVMLGMRDASVVEFHTHGFIANDVSEASYLVLSPEVDQQYAMTASDVARIPLAGAPLVLLGACYAATSSRSVEAGMGLAEAFLRAGARAVVASPDAVPDRGAHAFFAGVRERMMRGVEPAIAVRDERVKQLTGSPGSAWIAGVVVFE